jgi:creatinine amidohydrolase
VSALVERTWPEVAGTTATLVVPVGATEQHGPHLPLSTDTAIAQALVDRLVRGRADVVAAPAISYGSSGEHSGFAGTLSIGRAATELMLVELCRSATASFARVLLLSTHGGNADPIRRAVATLRHEGRDVHAWSPHWHGDAHAGRTETSVMLAVAPEHVRLSAASAGATAPVLELLPWLHAGGVRAVSENGVLGDPAGASAEEGHELLESATRELHRLLAAWDAAA